jgi:hypothetical protein
MEIAGNSASEYTPESLQRAVATCLTIAQVLGDTIMSDAVLVGGLVPTLLYAGIAPAPDLGAHVGTLDVDLAMDLVIFDEERYEEVAACLRRADFAPEETVEGNVRRQRWGATNGAKVDFLLPPVPPDKMGGKLQSLTKEFAALTMLGLDLAIKYRQLHEVSGIDLQERNVTREIPLCPPNVFVVLKALAIRGRKKAKDAYDIHYVLKHDPAGPDAIGRSLIPLLDQGAVRSALSSLRRDYNDVDGRGPQDVCSFLGQRGDDALAGDALAHVLALLAATEV